MGRKDKSSIFGAVRIKKKVLADNLKRAREAYRQKRAQMQQEQVKANENIASDLTKVESSPQQDSAEVSLPPAPSTSTSSTVAADRGSQNKPETVQDQATVNTG
ncbi:uncharacterized protein LOC124643894 [Helicoverpa zea]|uniref:uncharacterized protein LOC124643894 n=1 Tax=Helicoverpa zea TaxID=7113 RepID=UPI001F5929C0|nr:uncharacterized protein LOC124643894 [Helicoverpa zea]